MTSFFILLLATSGILFWQWNVYSEEKEASAKMEPASVQQSVQIWQKDQSLQITQTIHNIKKGTYTIINPQKVSYSIEGEKSTTNTISVPKDATTIIFHYQLPFNSKKRSELLTNWALQLQNVETTKSNVEITVSSNRNGSWAAAAKQVGKVKKEHIDYYKFEQDGPLYPLYYQQGQLQYTASDKGPYIYYENKVNNIKQVEAMFAKFPNVKNRVIIFTSKFAETHFNNLLIMENATDVESLNNKFANMYIDSILPFKEGIEEWQQHIIGNIIENHQLGGQKVAAMVKELQNQLLGTEIETFVQAILEEEQPLTSAKLDEILSEVKDKETTFFTSNRIETSPLIPLYFLDKRKIIVNGEPITENVLLQNNDKLLPFIAIVEKAGFSYSVISENEILLTKNEDTVRLYPNQKVFILNGTDYSVMSPPLTSVRGKVYIYEAWLIDIFGALIAENEQSINIKTM